MPTDITVYTFIEKVFTFLDMLLKNYVYNGYSALSHYMQAPLLLMITIYVILMGYGMMRGSFKIETKTLLKSLTTICVIYFFAMNWSHFSEYFVNGIEAIAGEIGDVLISATPIPLPHFSGVGINGAMQSVLIETVKIGQWIWDKGSWHNTGAYIDALLVLGFGLAMLAYAIFEIVVAKLMLALLFTTAPLFFSFTLFKKTQPFFDRWLGAIASFCFVLIFISAALALALSLFQMSIAGMYATQATGIHFISIIPIVFLGFIGLGLMKKVADYAQSFGGHISTGSNSNMLAGAVGGMVGSAMTMARAGLMPLKAINGQYQDYLSKSNIHNTNRAMKSIIDANQPEKSSASASRKTATAVDSKSTNESSESTKPQNTKVNVSANKQEGEEK